MSNLSLELLSKMKQIWNAISYRGLVYNKYSYYLEVRCKEDDAKKRKKLGFYWNNYTFFNEGVAKCKCY